MTIVVYGDQVACLVIAYPLLCRGHRVMILNEDKPTPTTLRLSPKYQKSLRPLGTENLHQESVTDGEGNMTVNRDVVYQLLLKVTGLFTRGYKYVGILQQQTEIRNIQSRQEGTSFKVRYLAENNEARELDAENVIDADRATIL